MRLNSKPINILFRNDDLCALSDAAHERRCLDIFAQYGIPQVVSVIPFMSEDPHNANGARFHELSENKEIVKILEEASSKGLVEIAQHGTTHQTNHLHPSNPTAAIGTPYPGLGSPWLRFAPMYPEKGYSEFNGLDKDLVRSELKRGKDYLNKIFQKSINTFTFPWGTLDENALTALKEEGFRTALCGGRNFYFVNGLMAIYNGREDVFEFTHELNNGRLKGPVLYHVVLHSWMLKAHELSELDKLLSGLAADKRVGFVTVEDLQQWPASFQIVRAADHRMRVWRKTANNHLGAPMWFPQRYDLNLASYWKDLLKSGLVTLIFAKIGLARSWILSGILLSIYALWSFIGQRKISLFELLGLISSGCFFLVLSAYVFKNRFVSGSHGIRKEDRQNYEKISAKAFGDPKNKFLVQAFFRLFEQNPDSFSEDREKYLQLKYFYSARPWIALNELAEGYACRGLNALAHMCYAESLRLDPKQAEIFKRMEDLKGVCPLKQPELKKDQYAVSVIICTNRLTRELRVCIQSILNQTFKDFEVILLNDGGPEDTQEVAGSFKDPRIFYKRVDRNIGPPKARNVAVQLARGQYIAYLDDDDVFYPDHLGTLYNVAQNGKHRFVYANTQGILGYLQDGEFCEKKKVFRWDSDFDRERFASRASIGNHSVLHEKSLFQDLGLFNDELLASEDEDFWLRCAAVMDLKHINQDTSEYRIKDDNNVVLNAARNHFNGAIVRQFHAAFQGELANLKYHVTRRDKREAQKSLDQIRARYLQGWFKSSFALDELRPLVKYCGDKEFLRMVVDDYRRLYKTEASMAYGRKVVKSGK